MFYTSHVINSIKRLGYAGQPRHRGARWVLLHLELRCCAPADKQIDFFFLLHTQACARSCSACSSGGGGGLTSSAHCRTKRLRLASWLLPDGLACGFLQTAHVGASPTIKSRVCINTIAATIKKRFSLVFIQSQSSRQSVLMPLAWGRVHDSAPLPLPLRGSRVETAPRQPDTVFFVLLTALAGHWLW